MVLNFSPFWVCLYNLPFGYRSDDRIRAIARMIRDVLEIEEDFLDISHFRRVRVMVDVTQPLKRFQMIRIKGITTAKIIIKYERLPHFCFLWGLMCHMEKDCASVSDEDKEKGYGWGMDIRASPRKGFSRLKEEVDSLKTKKCLFVPKPKYVPSPCKALSPLMEPNERSDFSNDIFEGMRTVQDGGVNLVESNKVQIPADEEYTVKNLLGSAVLVDIPITCATSLFDKGGGESTQNNVNNGQGLDCQSMN